jgi:hypothetical protein
MLKLFQSIFLPGADKLGAYPEDLIGRAIERAVDGTDRRLRAVAGHKKSLRPAVIRAIDHVVGLVDGFPPPIELSRANYGADAELNAYFASVDHMNEVLSRDAEVRQWRKTPASQLAERAVMLLIMEMRERNVLGLALEGGNVRRDVAQVTVSFGHHRLVDPSGVEEDTRRLLKRRAFDHLLTLALARMAEAHADRLDLRQERDLLRNKRAALAAGHWGFGNDEGAGEAAPPDLQALQKRIDEIDSQINSQGSGLLQEHLDILVDVLGQPGQNLRSERSVLCVDRQGVKQSQPGAQAAHIDLTRLYNSAGRSVVVRLVSVARADLPAAPDFLKEGQRFLI